jgi:signal transduction histidine kinase
MAPERLARITAARHAPALGVALLALAACGQAAAQAVGLAGHQPAQAVAVLYVLPLCLFALLSTVPLAVLGAAPAAVAVTAGNTASLAAFGTATVAGIAAQLIAAYWLGSLDESRSPHTRGVALAQPLAIGLAVPFGVLALTSHGSVPAVLLGAGAPAAAAAGITVRARREARIRTAAGEALAGTLTEHTARGERARIARELHDVVAHHISMIAVQAETGRLTTPGLPAAGAQRFAAIGDTARAGLTEMRRLLGVLREDAEQDMASEPAPQPARPGADRRPQPGLPQLGDLVDGAREASGGVVRLIMSGQADRLDPGVELAAYRIVQEALTNVARHAAVPVVRVQLMTTDESLRIYVVDEGTGFDAEEAVASGLSTGLAGMRERATLLQGTCTISSAPGAGTTIEVELPLSPNEETAADVAAAGMGDAGGDLGSQRP